MNIETLCDAVKGSLEGLRLSGCKYEGHTWVEKFQKNLADILNGTSRLNPPDAQKETG